MASELSEKILTLLLNEQEKLLTNEIDERQKQLEMITVIKESITGKASVSANTILDVEHIMEAKNRSRSMKKLNLVYVGVGIAAALGLAFMVWLAASRIWWGLAVYIAVATISLAISTLNLKDTDFICPKCDSIFSLSLMRAFFTTGGNKVRWMTCPDCGHKDWCVLQKQTPTGEVGNND